MVAALHVFCTSLDVSLVGLTDNILDDGRDSGVAGKVDK